MLDLNKLVITKIEYAMMTEEEKRNYTECDLCDNYFIMGEGGIYEEDNKINVCDHCLMTKSRKDKLN